MFILPLWAPLAPLSIEGNSRESAQHRNYFVLCSLSSFSHQPQTPHLEEDLKEVLRSEAGIELIIEDDMKPEKQKRKQGVS